MASDTNIQAGFVRPYRGRSANEQEAVLEAAGVKPIYSTVRGETLENVFGRLRRRGELIATAGGLRVLADTRREIVAAEAKIRSSGLAVINLDTGERSDLDGVSMLDQAVKLVHGEARVPDLEKARTNGRKGGERKGQSALSRRMPKRSARRFWGDPLLTGAQALEQMTGWTKETAYRHLGPRDTPAGRKSAGFFRRVKLKQMHATGGVVYFCRSEVGGPVKIGFATDVVARLSGLQTSHHSELILVNAIAGSHADEKALHERFKAYRLKGEWFRYAGTFKRYLDGLPSLDKA